MRVKKRVREKIKRPEISSKFPSGLLEKPTLQAKADSVADGAAAGSNYPRQKKKQNTERLLFATPLKVSESLHLSYEGGLLSEKSSGATRWKITVNYWKGRMKASNRMRLFGPMNHCLPPSRVENYKDRRWSNQKQSSASSRSFYKKRPHADGARILLWKKG